MTNMGWPDEGLFYTRGACLSGAPDKGRCISLKIGARQRLLGRGAVVGMLLENRPVRVRFLISALYVRIGSVVGVAYDKGRGFAVIDAQVFI